MKIRITFNLLIVSPSIARSSAISFFLFLASFFSSSPPSLDLGFLPLESVLASVFFIAALVVASGFLSVIPFSFGGFLIM